MSQFKEIHRKTAEIYERNARDWDRRRSRALFEKPWLDRFLQSMNSGCSVLDAGCGAGEPIARYLIERGLVVTGVDSSPQMIEISKSRFPEHCWEVTDLRKLALNKRFDGIIAWDSFFHLNPDEQRDVLQLFLSHLEPGGVLLLTVGPEPGEVLGMVEGEEVYHSSLAPEEYKEILYKGGLNNVEVTLNDKHCGGHSVLFAKG